MLVSRRRNVGAMNDMLSAVLVSGTGKRAALPAIRPPARPARPGFPRRLVHRLHRATRRRRVGRQRRRRSMNKVMGGSLPARLWHDVMLTAHEGRAPVPLSLWNDRGQQGNGPRCAAGCIGRREPAASACDRAANPLRLRLRHRCNASFYRGRSRMRPSHHWRSLPLPKAKPGQPDPVVVAPAEARAPDPRPQTSPRARAPAKSAAASGASARADQRRLHCWCT